MKLIKILFLIVFTYFFVNKLSCYAGWEPVPCATNGGFNTIFINRGSSGGGGGSSSTGGRCQTNDKCISAIQCMSVCKESNDPRQSCSSNSDCLKTAQAKCSSGEKLPHNECILEPFMDYSKNPPFLNDNDVGKCWPKYTCGVDQCSPAYEFNRYCYANRKCNDGEVKPHYECVYATKKCELIDDCGKNLCDPKKTEILKVNIGGSFEDIEINSECKGSAHTPSVYDWYVCDPNSALINGYGQCIVDNLNKYPNAVPCSKSNNKYQLVETVCSSNKDYSNHSTCLKQVAYNTDCYSGNPPSAPKPGVPDEEDDGDGPINSISCRIPTFSFYDKLAKPPKYVSNLFTTQKIVENPTLEYYAQDCDTCKLVITSEDGHDVKEFILNNSLFNGMLEPTGATDEENERYIFEASYIKLDTRGLKPGDYIISIHCTDPIFGGPVIGMRKFTTGEEYPPWLKLTIAPEIRWREVVPVISGQAE